MSDRDSFGWRRERGMVINVPPSEDMLREMFVADEIDVVEFERLLDFALAGRVVPDPPLALTSRLYERNQRAVRFSDAPGQFIEYRP